MEQTQDVALVYGAIGAMIFLAALGFSFTAVGYAGRYLSQEQ